MSNEEIKADYESGMTIREIVSKHHLATNQNSEKYYKSIFKQLGIKQQKWRHISENKTPKIEQKKKVLNPEPNTIHLKELIKESMKEIMVEMIGSYTGTIGKSEDDGSFKKELQENAEKFWAQDENKTKTPDKNTLPYLLIPKYGMETTKALIYASIHLKKEKQLFGILLGD